MQFSTREQRHSSLALGMRVFLATEVLVAAFLMTWVFYPHDFEWGARSRLVAGRLAVGLVFGAARRRWSRMFFMHLVRRSVRV